MQIKFNAKLNSFEPARDPIDKMLEEVVEFEALRVKDLCVREMQAGNTKPEITRYLFTSLLCATAYQLHTWHYFMEELKRHANDNEESIKHFDGYMKLCKMWAQEARMQVDHLTTLMIKESISIEEFFLEYEYYCEGHIRMELFARYIQDMQTAGKWPEAPEIHHLEFAIKELKPLYKGLQSFSDFLDLKHQVEGISPTVGMTQEFARRKLESNYEKGAGEYSLDVATRLKFYYRP